jgi:hypothetical protein
MAESPAPSASSAAPPLYLALRTLAAVVLVLMLVAVAYSAWISLVNWSGLGV